MIRRLEWARLSSEERAALLRRAESDLDDYVDAAAAIVAAVREEGDAALVRFAREFDRADISAAGLRVSEEEIRAAHRDADSELVESLRFAAENIRTFHRLQMPDAFRMHEVRGGVFAGERAHPLGVVGCYVPRGKGAFPSVFLMTTVPARVAEVERVVVLTPPGPDGRADHATLVAAHEVGGVEIYLAGGAQAVAAAAYGTETVPRCEKIVGPGSPWVGAAKRLLGHMIDTATPAGPSEAIIFADDSADGALAAMDLLVEAEHGPDSSAYLVTTSAAVADAAIATLPRLWDAMTDERVKYTRAVLGGDYGGVLIVPDLATAYGFINDYAPEHLEILSRDPFSHLGAIRNASEVLLGSHTPVPLGNFVLGPNAVLPTGGAARRASPLSVHDYLRRSSVGYVTPGAYSEMARHAEYLARYEGFSAHGNAVSSLRREIMKSDEDGG
ncbi:MAG: histidinol dehydrogenase [Alphaproteobacteria bacterium]|nr:histidinol dehydrogenase [Alphaproteobacteria bacterium]